jgi:hypothetical protein
MTEKAKTTTRTPRPTRRSIGLAPDLLADAPPTPADEPTPAPAKARRTTSTPKEPAAATPPVTPVAPKAEPEMVNTDARPGEEYWGEPTVKLTVNIPTSLHRRFAGLLLNQQITGEPADISSLTDGARLGLHQVVSHWEKELNGGEPFTPPKNGLRRGRR